jgi:hypothetical protein
MVGFGPGPRAKRGSSRECRLMASGGCEHGIAGTNGMPTERRTARSPSVLIGLMIMLVALNYLLLRYEPQLWRAFSGVESEIPSRRAVNQWSLFRLAVGVVLLPLSGLVVWWRACSTRAVPQWGRGTLLVFLVGMAAMHAHLSWMYDWCREQHLALSSAVLRTIILLSLNAPIYLSIAGLIVLGLWLRSSRRARRRAAIRTR